MNELFEIFETFNLPYFRQGSLSDDNFPDSFFTFWNYDTPNDSFYDDNETRYIEKVMVYFYTNKANLIYSVMDEFTQKAKEKGFVIIGRAYDTPSGKVDYFGRLININIIHRT